MPETAATADELIAAIDLGSNSFHMIVARQFHGEFRMLEKRGQKVQLAAGLDENFHLSEEAQQRGLTCLQEFSQRLMGMDPDKVSVLATNALRAARNRQEFISRAEKILGFPIEVIAGREEARLIYLGVSHTLADDSGNRLVVDIGGGSTEFIIGNRFEPLHLESLHMGCVSYTKRFFPDGNITESGFEEAVAAARRELMRIEAAYKKEGWQSVVGSSGTIRAAESTAVELGWSAEGLNLASLKKLRKKVLQFKTLDDVSFPGVKYERRQVFIGGLAILTAVFETFELEQMQYSDGALREGALWDLVGRSAHENVRARTVSALQSRYHVDLEQSERVKKTALNILAQLEGHWELGDHASEWLAWAADLHEIGLSLSHSGFHKHGAYILQHSDMLGFTRQGQMRLGAMVRCHRRKLVMDEFRALSDTSAEQTLRLARILRLAVILNHSRGVHKSPELTVSLTSASQGLQLQLPAGWLARHPLTERDLNEEVRYLSDVGIQMVIEAE